MKKSIITKLVALTIAGSLLLGGCSSGGGKAVDAAGGTTGGKVYKIGISQLVEHAALDDARKGFEDGLKELGVNAEVTYQNAQGDIANTVSIAQKFVSDKVDLIYAIATPAAQSAKQASSGIPVLFSAVTDPVKSGIVKDWQNVGGNVTGTSDMAPTASQLKMFEAMDSNIKKIGILYNTSESNSEIQVEEIKALAPAEGLEVVTVGVSNINEIPQALTSIMKKADAIYIISDNMVASSVELVSKTLIENNMISVSSEETQVRGGILVTNGLNYYELGRQTAVMAKEILVDKKDISTIPVGKAEKTTTIVNQNTLKALGLNENLPLFKDAVKVGN